MGISDGTSAGGSGSSRFAPAARAAVEPFHVMRVWAAAQRRREQNLPVFNLSAGQPSTPAPQPVLAAARRALDTEILGYTEALGIAPLREAIAGHYRERYGMDVDPGSVVVTTGSSGGFVLSFLAAFDAGATVALARPGYPAYRNTLAAMGCNVIDLPCGADTRFQPTVPMLENLREGGVVLDGLIVASPANPTGTMLTPGEMAELTAYCAENGIRLISDEIYHGITYGDGYDNPTEHAGVGVGGGAPHPAARRQASAWETDRSSIVVGSFSKYFSMTGWRIGWLLAPDDLLGVYDALAGNVAICPPAPAQFAAVAAFDAYDECDAHVVRYAANRELLISGLVELGLTTFAPADGAFYVYADTSHIAADSEQLCWELLDRTGVATAPGRDFDPVDGHRHLRMSFAGSADVIEGALGALGDFLRR